MSLKAVSIKNLANMNHNENNYRVNFTFIRKKDAYNLIKNATITDKKGTLEKKDAYNLIKNATITDKKGTL